MSFLFGVLSLWAVTRNGRGRTPREWAKGVLTGRVASKGRVLMLVNRTKGVMLEVVSSHMLLRGGMHVARNRPQNNHLLNDKMMVTWS